MPNPFEQAVAEQRAIADAMTPQTRRRPTRRQRARVAVDVGDIVTTPSDAIVEERVTDAAPVAAVPVAVAEERPAEPAEVGHDEAIVRAPESPVAAAQAQPDHDDDVVVQTAAQRPAVAPTTEEHRAETEPVAAVVEPPDDLDAPIVGGKPQAASADVLEPDDRIVRLQDDRARLEEARRRGRRRDIAMGVTGGVLALGGGLMAGLGALSGNEGLMAAGGSLGTIGGAMPMGARRRLVGDVQDDIAFRDQQEGIARQIAKQQADEVARGRQLGLAERNADNYERNTLENQRASQARASLASAQASRESELFRRQYDPETEQAVQARNRLLAAINRYAAAVPGASTDDYQDVYRQAGYIGALEIEPSIEDVERQITSGVRRRGGGGGGGGGSRPQTSGDPAAQQAAYNELVQRYSRTTGIPEDTVRASNPDIAAALDGGSPQSLFRQTAPLSSRATEVERSSIINGWDRVPDAPVLTDAAANQARERVAMFETVSQYIQRIRAISNEVGAAQAAGGRAGFVDQKLAEAAQLQEQISNILRDIGNYGVPNGTELVRMESLAPRIDSADGLLNASAKYAALRSTLWTRVRNRMRQDGYVRGGGQ